MDDESKKGINSNGHYNFLIVDRELIMVEDANGKNIKSCLDLSLEALGLYTVLKAHAIDKNFVWPSLKTLENLTGKTKKTLLIYLNELAKKNLIKIRKVKNIRRGGKPYNEYLMLPVNKEFLKKQGVNSTLSSGARCKFYSLQGVNSTLCKVENLHPKYNNNKYNNINIIRDVFEKLLNLPGAKKTEQTDKFYNYLYNNFQYDLGSIELQERTLIVEHKYIDSLKQIVNKLIASLGLWDDIKIIYSELNHQQEKKTL